MNIESAAVRWVAANIVAAVLPPCLLNSGVTGCLECPHCGFGIHGYQAIRAPVWDDKHSHDWMVYECVRCGATWTSGDRFGAW